MPQYVKVGGTWRTVDETTKCGSVKVGGVWKDVQSAYVKVGGNWRSVCSSAPEIVLSITNIDSGGQYNVRLSWTLINVPSTATLEVYSAAGFIGTVGASVGQYDVNNLACGTTHQYFVKVQGGSITSNTVSRTTPACPPPPGCSGPSPTITNAQASSTGQTTATVTFNASGMYSYQIYGGGYNSGTINSTATSVSHNITGLTCGTSYTFSVVAMAVANGVPNQAPASGCQTVGAFPQITTSACPPTTTTTTGTTATTSTTTTTTTTTTAVPTTYWATGCCSAGTDNQVTGTSQVSSAAAIASRDSQCFGTITSSQTGSYTTTNNIPTLNCFTLQAYYGAACCNGSVAYFSSTQNCTVVSNWFGDNCTTVSNFVCNFGTAYPSTTCPTTTTTTATTTATTATTSATTATTTTTASCTGCTYAETTQEYICVGTARYLYECDVFKDSCGNVCNTNCSDYLVSNCSATCGCGGGTTTSTTATSSATTATSSATTATSSATTATSSATTATSSATTATSSATTSSASCTPGADCGTTVDENNCQTIERAYNSSCQCVVVGIYPFC